MDAQGEQRSKRQRGDDTGRVTTAAQEMGSSDNAAGDGSAARAYGQDTWQSDHGARPKRVVRQVERYAGEGSRMVQTAAKKRKRPTATNEGRVPHSKKLARGNGGQVGVKRQIEVSAATIQRTAQCEY